MKNLTFLTFLITILLFSCSNENTKTVEADPCAKITCQNNGTCINGKCSCPKNYEGPACEQEKTPRKMSMTITVTKIPAFKENGTGWDTNGSAPDIYLKIYDAKPKLLRETNYYQNAQPNGTYKFSDSYVLIESPTTPVIVKIYDYDDFSSDELMLEAVFNPYKDGEGFPETVNYNTKDGRFSFTAKYSYTW